MTDKPLCRDQCLATAFAYNARQNINNYVREYEACGENLFDYLRHKRKVAPVVVSAVRDEFNTDALANTGTLCLRGNQRLGRDDHSSAYIRVA
jgi:hypothetical protein